MKPSIKLSQNSIRKVGYQDLNLEESRLLINFSLIVNIVESASIFSPSCSHELPCLMQRNRGQTLHTHTHTQAKGTVAEIFKERWWFSKGEGGDSRQKKSQGSLERDSGF